MASRPPAPDNVCHFVHDIKMQTVAHESSLTVNGVSYTEFELASSKPRANLAVEDAEQQLERCKVSAMIYSLPLLRGRKKPIQGWVDKGDGCVAEVDRHGK